MSKMRSANSRRRWVVAFFAVTVATLAGCGRVDVHSPDIRGMAYVRLDDVVKHHPLYPQLAQLGDAIAAIGLQVSAPRVPLSAGQIAEQTKILNAQLQQAQDRANKTLAQMQQSYAQREQQAVAAALTAAGVSGAGAYAASQMSATSAQQQQQAAEAANQDLMAYQQSVISEDNAAVNSIARQLQMQAAQKYRAKAEELQQNETDLSLRITQQDAAQRLAIKTRLSNLALDESTHQQLQSQLNALDSKEAAAIQTQRAADAKILQAYQAQLSAETSAAVQSQAGAINAQTRSKIESRRDEVGAQLRSIGPAALPANLPPAVQSRIAGIHKQFVAQFQADAQKIVAQYNATKSDLDAQFQALHGADVGATGKTAVELTSLRQRQNDLTAQITSQIQREAQRLAAERGFTVVFSNPEAATGGYDLTNELIKDVESLHE
jgi:hypothetical protein